MRDAQDSRRGKILGEAEKIINGERMESYGKPEHNFALISDLWSLYIGKMLSPHDVAMMMCLLKVARIKTGTGSMDSYRDLCGYAALAAEMH